MPEPLYVEVEENAGSRISVAEGVVDLTPDSPGAPPITVSAGHQVVIDAMGRIFARGSWRATTARCWIF